VILQAPLLLFAHFEHWLLHTREKMGLIQRRRLLLRRPQGLASFISLFPSLNSSFSNSSSSEILKERIKDLFIYRLLASYSVELESVCVCPKILGAA